MIQHSFTGAYQSEVGARNQGINTIGAGIKDAATLALGITGFAGGFGTSTLGKSLAKGAEHALAGRVGGVGGNIMLATLQQKKESASAREDTKQLFSAEEVGQTIQSQLGDNPINRAAKKNLATVFETLANAKEEKLINKQGNIESSIGEIDPNSKLGKKILSNLEERDDLQKKHKDQIKKLADDKFEDGTYELDTLKPVNYNQGYQATFRLIGDRYTNKEYQERVKEFLQASSDSKISAGKFGGEPEISFHINDYDTAYNLGKKYNQISIWDWKNNEEIKTGGTGAFTDYIKHKK